MGQYFKLVNLDKKEVVCPWCIGGVAKLWEWCAGNGGRILPFLLRKSDGDGGGDIMGVDYPTAGRWTGDRIVLIGDYDSSGLWDRLYKKGVKIDDKGNTSKGEYHNISEFVVADFNHFIHLEDMKLEYKKCKHCGKGNMKRLKTVRAIA